jgi:hypothetical protein
VKYRDVELLGELAAHVLRIGDGEPVGAGGLVAVWKPMNRAGLSGVE